MSTIRNQVLLEIAETIRQAQKEGKGDGFAAARAAFPGIPETVLHEAWVAVDMATTNEWWDSVERTIDGEVIRKAISVGGGAGSRSSNNNVMPSCEWRQIELYSGRIIAAHVETAQGVRALPELAGELRFFVDAVDAEGCRLGINTCVEYEDAMQRAEAARLDFGIDHPVLDEVAGRK